MPEQLHKNEYPASQLSRSELGGEHWEAFAACGPDNPEVFFPGAGNPGNLAIYICGLCRVRDICLEENLKPEALIDHGVRAALTNNNFRKLRPLASNSMEQALAKAHELQAANMDRARKAHGKVPRKHHKKTGDNASNSEAA